MMLISLFSSKRIDWLILTAYQAVKDYFMPRNRVHCTFLFTFFALLFLKRIFWHTILPNTNNVLNKSTRPIDRTLTDTTTSVKVDLVAMAMKEYSALPQKRKPCHQMQFNVIPGNSLFRERVLLICKGLQSADRVKNHV